MMEEIDIVFGIKSGCPADQCDCGLFYYDSFGEFMEECELERYQNKDQNKFIAIDGGPTSIDVALLGHRIFGCKCKWESKLLKFLDTQVDGIKEYYKYKSTKLQKQSKLFLEAGKDERG
jgi:hypothetical protein